VRYNLVTCALALSLVFGMSEAAKAQCRGPPAASASSGLSSDVTQSDLIQRLMALQQALTGRTDAGSVQMLSYVKAMLVKLRSQPEMSQTDLNAIDATVQRYEAAVG